MQQALCVNKSAAPVPSNWRSEYSKLGATCFGLAAPTPLGRQPRPKLTGPKQAPTANYYGRMTPGCRQGPAELSRKPLTAGAVNTSVVVNISACGAALVWGRYAALYTGLLPIVRITRHGGRELARVLDVYRIAIHRIAPLAGREARRQ